jgi:Tol biopolymer transport system component/DNA-binding winged helix-turn-helix (wHTH) protein
MPSGNDERIYEFGPFRLDPSQRLLQRNGVAVGLTPKAFDLLIYMVEHKGRLVEKATLMAALWPDASVEEANLAFQVSALRKALGDDREDTKFIETVPTRGYRFIAPVVVNESSPARLPSPSSRWWWGTVAALVGIVASLVAWQLRPMPATQEPAPTSVPLTTFTGWEGMPTFSPDGKQVAFVWNGEKQDNLDIYVKLIGPGPPLRVTTDAAADRSPAWSPNGDTIAFVRLRGDKVELLLVPALGGPERKLVDMHFPLRNFFALWSPPFVTWSQDGQWVVFCSGEPRGVLALSLKTGEQHILTFPPKGWHDSGVALSPDGRALAFVRASNAQTYVYVLPVSQDLRSAGEARRLPSRHGASITVSSPAWTADGREIMFSIIDSGIHKGLWRVAASGTQEPERVTVAGDNSEQPAIARQGRRLVYTSAAPDSNLWRMELVGGLPSGQPTRLIASTMEELSAQYSPDGKKIAFTSTRSGSAEIWSCDADGANAVQITALGSDSGSPTWSPDSLRIVFDSNTKGRYQIYVVDAGGGVPRRLTDSPTDDAAPSFSRDGQRIYYSSLRTARWEVWTMAADGRQQVQVTRTGGFSPVESPDGQVLYYQKTQDISDIWTMPVRGGDETKVVESVGQRRFAVRAEGIYCIRATEKGQRLQFFDFASRTLRDLAPLGRTQLGLTVSSDGRSVLYSQLDQAGSDLMLVENFH